MQGHLLSSSYCVRLGRLRFRTAYMATGREAEGAGGRQQTEEVSTHSPLCRDPEERGRRGGRGPGSTQADRRDVQVVSGGPRAGARDHVHNGRGGGRHRTPRAPRCPAP